MSKLKEKIILSTILPLAEKAVGTCACKWYKTIREMNTWSATQIQEWQNQQLSLLIHQAYNHTVYYREIMDQLGLTPNDIRTKEDLKKLPILTKEIIRERYDDLVADNASNFRFRKDHTGGTTGSPMNYLCDENVWGYVTANKMVSWSTTSYCYGDKFIALGSAALFRKKPSIKRRIYDRIRAEIALNSMNLSDEICAKYVRRIQREQIHYIYGYATAIYVLAQYVKRTNSRVDIRGAFTTSENLTEQYRAIIEEAFGCRVMDCYGARDAGVTAYEVLPSKYFLGYISMAETVNEFAPNSGTLLSTNLINYCFPMIRYNFGDDATLTNDASIYNGQLITKIWGRTSDVIRLSNGHNLTAPGFTILMLNFDVRAFQIRKVSDKEIVMMIQPIPELFNTKQESSLLKELEYFVGEGCKVSIEKVEHFEALANGKHRFFYNK